MVNVLFIVCDALRPDHLRCYGYSKETSPFIDKLAKEGVLFKNTIANCNHTIPGLVSLFTGLYQTTHMIDGPKNYQYWGDLWKGWETPFNILEDKGYVVAGPDPAIYGHIGYRVEVKDVSLSIRENKNKPFFIWYRSEVTHLPYNPEPPYDKIFLPEAYRIEKSTEKKLEIVKTKMLIHRPGLLSRMEKGTKDPIEKPGYERTFAEEVFLKTDRPAIIALYDGEIRLLDKEIEKYVKILEDLNLLDKTLIVITADHGEQLLERGALGHSSCSLEGNLYDENIKIPLIIRYPRIIPQGKIIETQVSQIDIMPTVFELLGLQVPGQTEGHSLIPLIKDEKIDFKEESYAMTQPCGWQVIEGDERMIYCIRTSEWKLIYYEDPNNKESNYYELYNLKDDTEEKENLIHQEPKIAKELKEKLEHWIGKRYEGKKQ